MDNNPGNVVRKETLGEALIHATNLPKDMVTNAVEAVTIASIDPHVITLNNEELPDAYVDPHIILDKEELSGKRLISVQHLNGIGLSNQVQQIIEAPTNYKRHKNPFPDYEFTPEQGQELLSASRVNHIIRHGGNCTKKENHIALDRNVQVIPEFEFAEIPGPLVRAEDIFVEPSSENTVPRSAGEESEPESSSE